MKKLVACILTLIMVLSLAGCGSSANDKLVGNWYVVQVDGSIFTVTLEADGTGRSASEEITWSSDGNDLTISGSYYDEDFTYDDYYIYYPDGEIFAYRDKDQAIEAGKETAEEWQTGWYWEDPSDSTGYYEEDDIYGRWEGVYMVSDGETVYFDDADMTFEMYFYEDGTVLAYTNGEDDGSATWYVENDQVIINDGSSQKIAEIHSSVSMTVYLDDIAVYMDWMEWIE